MRHPRLAGLVALVLMMPSVLSCSTPPQVLDIGPERGAQQVASNAEVRIRFDRPMDRQSVAAHFSTRPPVDGALTWNSPTQVVYRHDPFRAGIRYTVRLSAGYRDAMGRANGLHHSWSFTTEPPPVLTGSSPAAHDQNVDPASDLVLAFSRAMDIGSMRAALKVEPETRISVIADPADARRVVIAPQALLHPGTAYSITVTPDARDVDGNPLPRGLGLEFSTGQLRPLRHWVTFSAGPQEADGGVGIWVVDSGRLPREVTSIPARAFTWSEDGSHLLIQGIGGAWSDAGIGDQVTRLPFTAGWASYLGGGQGFAYLQSGRLMQYSADGVSTPIDEGVLEASVAPGGMRIGYVVGRPGAGSEVRGYDAGLRSHYRVQSEPGLIEGLRWSPDGSRIAYRVAAAEPGRHQVRVRNLVGAGRAATVGIGEVGLPAWQSDSRHLVLSATVTGPAGPTARAFRLSATDGATRPLAFADAIPSAPGVEITAPEPSPDGHTLAFLAPSDGGLQVWVMNADGTGLAQLTRYDAAAFPYSCRALAWTRR